ncbi:alkaline phosphatase D family protein [Peribacillus simplex]|uniref:alkaline phosphatase D family protein n=1 Tax=Peribacillus simplex TaxID=1478 RepID=UPI003673515D
MKNDHGFDEVKRILKNNEESLKSIDRRKFLQASGKVASLALGLTIANQFNGLSVSAEAPSFKSYPFTLGIASGEPLPDSVVLWTRLAPDPLNGGGMKQQHDVPVKWEVARDEHFRNVVKHGVEFARAQFGHSVHAEVYGLQPGTEYFYRFKVGNDISQVGRTKTLPPFTANISKLSFAFASCQHYNEYFTAYDHMAKEDLDLVYHLGDYIYETGQSGDGADGRIHNTPEIYTLEDYRNRYALYKSDVDLQKAHEAFPWIVTWDDHEVEDNYAGGVPSKNDQTLAEFAIRRAAAYQAYYEHMPLRRTSMPHKDSMQLYRTLTYGNLAHFNILDTRQYRDDQANGDLWKSPTPESEDPKRTILGDEQEAWLLGELDQSKATWNVLAQQVFFARRDGKMGAGDNLSMDAWDGYPAARNRILSHVRDHNISNLVVLTGDVHTNWANDIKLDYTNPDSPSIGVEFVGTSITSGGDGYDIGSYGINIMKENPHIKFYNNQRGYIRCTVTPQSWQSDYRVVPYVSRPGAAISTRISFKVENGKPGLQNVGQAIAAT